MKRIVSGLALLLCLAVPVSRAGAQGTVYWATGGDIFFTMIGFNDLPFQLFLEAVSAPGTKTLLFEETGSAFSMMGGPLKSNQLLGTDDFLDLGTFDPGEQLKFTMLTAQGPVVGAGLLAQFLDGVQVEMVSGSGQLGEDETRAEFRLQGINKMADASCTRNNSPDIACTPIATPEPATLALVGTGLVWMVGLVGFRRRRQSLQHTKLIHDGFPQRDALRFN